MQVFGYLIEIGSIYIERVISMANIIFLILMIVAVIILPLLGIPILLGFIIYKVLTTNKNRKGPAEELDEEQAAVTASTWTS